MSPPIARPFPRFVGDATREREPYGRWSERLAEAFADACASLAEEAGAPLDPDSLRWFPERGYGDRVYMPVTGHGAEDEGADAEGATEGVEYFGHVSFERTDDGEPGELRAKADFTDVTAADNPDWKMDLNDDVIGKWHADGGRGGDITLVWGLPMVRGAVAVTAEVDEQVVDQAAIQDGRFTLVAVDAVHGFGNSDLFMEIVLWDRTLRRELARESLYAEGEDEEDDEEDRQSAEAGGA